MKKIIVMGIPHHGNLGDNAIAVAEEEILKKYFSDYPTYFMQEDHLDVCAERVKKYINNEDIILLHGGGNIGDTYERPEKGRRKVIELYPNNKIIVFPQTAYFSDSEKGKEELEISKRIYNGHKHLVLLAREKKSYFFMKEHFDKAKVYLTPDIVMTLERKTNKPRKGALLLFRGDREKTLDNKIIEEIKSMVNERYGSYILSDMSVKTQGHNVSGAYRDRLLKEKWNEFQTAKIAITDRLHGMIFAAITETPCIAFGNFNYKIIESYEWLKDLDYIQFCNNIEELEEKIEKVESTKNINYNNHFAEEKIVSILKQEIRG